MFCSPSTQRIASTMFVLPLPFGPTTDAIRPEVDAHALREGFEPWMSSRLRNTCHSPSEGMPRRGRPSLGVGATGRRPPPLLGGPACPTKTLGSSRGRRRLVLRVHPLGLAPRRPTLGRAERGDVNSKGWPRGRRAPRSGASSACRAGAGLAERVRFWSELTSTRCGRGRRTSSMEGGLLGHGLRGALHRLVKTSAGLPLSAGAEPLGPAGFASRARRAWCSLEDATIPAPRPRVRPPRPRTQTRAAPRADPSATDSHSPAPARWRGIQPGSSIVGAAPGAQRTAGSAVGFGEAGEPPGSA